MDRIKSFFRSIFSSNIDDLCDELRQSISENSPRAEENLKKLGWNIISVDRRLFFYSYRIQKGDSIHTVSITEALLMK
jgi:hypothetical protein